VLVLTGGQPLARSWATTLVVGSKLIGSVNPFEGKLGDGSTPLLACAFLLPRLG
jgi:hypothetical protein